MKFITALAGSSLLAPPCIAFKKKRLAKHGRNGRRLERFGDEESRLRTLAGQKTLGKRCDENDRHFEQFQKLVHGIKTGAAVGELDVGENETGRFGLGEPHRLAMRARDAEHVVPEGLDKPLGI